MSADWTVGCSATVTIDDDGQVSVAVYLEELAVDVGDEGATPEQVAAVAAWLEAQGTEHRIVTAPELGGGLLEALADADRALPVARWALDDAARACRAAGLSWQTIGRTLGVSRQAAWERFRHLEG